MGAQFSEEEKRTQTTGNNALKANAHGSHRSAPERPEAQKHLPSYPSAQNGSLSGSQCPPMPLTIYDLVIGQSFLTLRGNGEWAPGTVTEVNHGVVTLAMTAGGFKQVPSELVPTHVKTTPSEVRRPPPAVVAGDQALYGELSFLDQELLRTSSDESARSLSRSSQIDEDDIEGLTLQSTVFLMVTAIVGCGVVALPSLMKLGGWFLAPVIACVTSCAFMEVGRVLHDAITRCENPQGDQDVDPEEGFDAPVVRDFEDFGRLAAGETGGLTVRAVTTTGFFGTLVVYTILITQNVHCVLDGRLTRVQTLIMITPVLLALSMLKDLQAMAKIMPIGVFASLLSCFMICVKSGLDSRLWREAAAEDLSALDEFHSIVPAEFNCLGTIMAVLFAAYSVMGTVPSIRGKMQDPLEFPKAFNTALSIVLVVYMAVMLSAYYGYGNYVKSNVVSSMIHPFQIQHGDEGMHRPWFDKIGLGKMMSVLVTSYLLIGFTLFFTVVMGMVQKLRPESSICVPLSALNRCMRVTIVLAVSGIGLCMPHFREVMAIMASVCVTCNNVFFPLFFSHKLEWDANLKSDDPRRTSVCRNIGHFFILCLGIFCFCLGLHDSILKLIEELAEDKLTANGGTNA